GGGRHCLRGSSATLERRRRGCLAGGARCLGPPIGNVSRRTQLGVCTTVDSRSRLVCSGLYQESKARAARGGAATLHKGTATEVWVEAPSGWELNDTAEHHRDAV